MAPSYEPIECSAQPLALAFHPERETIVAAALVDGTMEVHDFQPILDNAGKKKKALKLKEVFNVDEDDTILSSTAAHNQDIRVPSLTDDTVTTKKASCRTVLFSNQNAHRIYTGGSAGDLVCIDASKVCSFTSNTEDVIAWRVAAASVGTKSHATKRKYTKRAITI